MKTPITVERKTLETDVSVRLWASDSVEKSDITVDTGVPFLNHILNAFAYYGGFKMEVRATGDIDVDDHHTVEDVGIVLGTAFRQLAEETGPISRFGSTLLPMDDALAEVAVDFSGRAYLVYNVSYPQPYAGRFDVSLLKEFFTSFTSNARANVHVNCRYGENSHHIAEALFKAFGRAVGAAYQRRDAFFSTKGSVD